VACRGTRAFLETEADLYVVGHVTDGAEVIPAVDRLRPDLLLLDVAFPQMSGLEVLRQLRRRRGVRTLVLSAFGDEAYVQEALRQGSAGYILKGIDGPELVRAIRMVAAGRTYLSPEVAACAQLPPARPEDEALQPHETLTLREREVLQMAARGFPNAEIAARLYIGVRTVETHRANLMRKLGLRNHAELIHYATRRGLLPPSG